MRRLVSAAVLLVVLTAALAQVAQASGMFAEWRVAQFANAPGRGSASSVLSVCAATDGTVVSGDPTQLKCGAGQVGPANDIVSPRVTTVLQGRHPGEAWQLDVFDRGTCNAVTHVVVALPSITIAANGRGTSRLLFSPGQYAAAAAAFHGSLRLRLTHRGLHYCAPYGPTAHLYTLIDPGTLGGPQAFLNAPGIILAENGTLLGTADTSTPDAYYPNFNPFMIGFPDATATHAFAYRNGVMTDLGALPGTNSSAVFAVNGRGVGTGMSENGIIDPVTGWPAENAVLFKDGRVINLGTLPGGYESQAIAINDSGLVSGFGSNGINDPFSILGFGTQSRTFVWQDGVMTDIGTLGGPDAVIAYMNGRGQIAGWSYTNSTPNAVTGVPTSDPFLWQNGHMLDLGTLGGTQGIANWLNNRSQVVGQSDLAGDLAFHPFLWDGRHMLDLGTLGGKTGTANFVDDAGVVVGKADLPDGTHHAFVWKNGHMRDLRPVNGDPCSNALAINNRGEVVGDGSDCHTVFKDAILWKDGVAYDLNKLIAPSGLHLTVAQWINDEGAIAGVGVLPDGSQHAFLLVPNSR